MARVSTGSIYITLFELGRGTYEIDKLNQIFKYFRLLLTVFILLST